METNVVYIMGIKCTVQKMKCLDGKKRDCYTYTVPGWEQCTTTGIRDTKRVINARLSPMNQWLHGTDIF